MIDNTKIAFSSDARYARLALKGSSNFSVSAFGITTVTVPHPLGYKPYYKLWYKIGTRYIQLFAGPANYDTGSSTDQAEDNYADTANVYANFSSTGSAYNGTLYYRIYEEPQ